MALYTEFLEKRSFQALEQTGFVCTICLKVCWHPSETICNHFFCVSCISAKTMCPICCENIPSTHVHGLSKYRRRMLDKQFVSCNNCLFEGTFKNFRIHVDSRSCWYYAPFTPCGRRCQHTACEKMRTSST